jgi:hypothetical protein
LIILKKPLDIVACDRVLPQSSLYLLNAGVRSRTLSFSVTSIRESRPSLASSPSGVAHQFSTVHSTIKNNICTASLIAIARAKYVQKQKQNQRISLSNYGLTYTRARLGSRMEILKVLKAQPYRNHTTLK